MRLSRVDSVIQKFPDGTTSNAVSLSFEDGPNVVVKRIKISDCAVKVGVSPKEGTYQVLKASREAARDLAFQKYGEKWKEHFEPNKFWNADMTGDEKELVKSAVEMLFKQVN